MNSKYEEAAKEYEENNASFSSNPADWVIEGFLAGAAHAEKEAYNRAIEDAIAKVCKKYSHECGLTILTSAIAKLKKP